MASTRSRRIRRNLGISLMVGSMAAGASALFIAPAGAQDGEAETVALEIVQQAYYSSSAGRAAPNTVTNEFPPGVACIVRPELCPEEGAEVFGAVGGTIGQAEDVPTGPAQRVQPGTLPVGTQGGETAYTSALMTNLPEVPEGQQVGQFVLRLSQDEVQSFHTSSPMFRQAVLTALASYQSGGFNQEEFDKAMASDPVTDQITGVEACPIITPWEGGENLDEELTPEVECLYGTNGVFIEGENIWEFDLTFTAEAWQRGSLENLGILLRPAAAPNLAYGDKDITSSSRVVFKTVDAPEAAITNEPKPTPPAPFTPAPAPVNNTPTYSAPISSGGIASTPIFQPEVAPQPEAAPAPEPVLETVAAVPFVPTEPGSAWWIWLLVPVFLAGMYLTSQTLAEEVVLAGEREGAMSRLISNQGVGSHVAPGPRQGAMSRLVTGA